MKTLIVIDMQNDFVTGVLGSKEAVAALPNVKKKIWSESKNTMFSSQLSICCISV